jgi:hypothetical protein
MIDKGIATGYKRYKDNYEYYEKNQREILPHLAKFGRVQATAERQS